MVRLGLNPAETPIASVVNYTEHADRADAIIFGTRED